MAVLVAGQLLISMKASSDPVSFSDNTLRGTYKCNLTAYALPAKAPDPFAVTGIGEISAVADGNGKWTEGSWSHTIDAPTVHGICKLTLTSGTYSVNADGTGSENTSWQLVKSDSSPDCLTFFPDTSSGESQLVVSNSSGQIFYATSISRFAILASACQK